MKKNRALNLRIRIQKTDVSAPDAYSPCFLELNSILAVYSLSIIKYIGNSVSPKSYGILSNL